LKTPLEILATYWGHLFFRSKQEAIIQSILKGNDTIALLPTGGGKSICFQVPTLVNAGICVVITPLVALMSDQVKSLKDKGIKAISIQGGISFNELSSLLDNAIYGGYKFIYMSAERLQQEIVQNAIQQMNVCLFAIDEAHCISQWGNDFRPAYNHISVVRELHPSVPIVALTATATKKVLADAIDKLNLKNPTVISDSFLRSNISYQVKKVPHKEYYLQKLLLANKESAIVYVRSRKKAEYINQLINGIGVSATFYHGGVSSVEKVDRLLAWKNNQISTMVATNAFGMGVDHACVRLVVHLQLPENIENYFQEAGRAGRDQKRATAILLYTESDKQAAYNQFIETQPSVNEVKNIYRKFCNYFQLAYGEGAFTHHYFNFNDFCAAYKLKTALTYHTLQLLDRLSIIKLSKEFQNKTFIKFIAPSKILLDEFEKNPSFSIIGKTILRMYGGVLGGVSRINLEAVSKKTTMTVSKIITVLKTMENRGLLELEHTTSDASITFIEPREDQKTINRKSLEIKAIKIKKKQEFNAVIHYIENTTVCRSLQLVSYFGEVATTSCGICEVCKEQNTINKESVKGIAETIVSLIKDKPMTSREINEFLFVSKKNLLEVLLLLLDSGKIKIDSENRYYIKINK